MSNPFPLVKGVTIIAPVTPCGVVRDSVALTWTDAAKELTAVNYGSVKQRANIKIPLGPTADGVVTHYAGSWGTTTPGFWESVILGSLADPALYPDEIDADLVAKAYGNWQLWDPGNLIQTMATEEDFDPLKINMVPRRDIPFREVLDHLPALVRVTSTEA